MEHVQVDAWLAGALRTRELAWLQYRDGSVDAAQRATERAVLASIFDSPIPRPWWARVGRYVTGPEFTAYVDEQIAATLPTGRLWNTHWPLPDTAR